MVYAQAGQPETTTGRTCGCPGIGRPVRELAGGGAMSRRDKEAGSEVPSRLEAMAVWRQALSQSNWLETCPIVELAVVEARGRVTA